MVSNPITSWQIDGETMETEIDFIFLGSKITANGDCSHETKKNTCSWEESYDQPRQYIKKQRHYFANKGPSSQSYGLSSIHVWMWELDHKQSWALKNWCFWTVVLEKTLESPLDTKGIKPVNPKENQSWVFIERTDTIETSGKPSYKYHLVMVAETIEAETPILWPADAKSWLIWKDPDAGKDWRQEKKGMTEDEMVGWHHWLKGHKFEQALGVGDGQGGLACCSPWGRKESDSTEWLNWLTEEKNLPQSGFRQTVGQREVASDCILRSSAFWRWCLRNHMFNMGCGTILCDCYLMVWNL